MYNIGFELDSQVQCRVVAETVSKFYVSDKCRSGRIVGEASLRSGPDCVDKFPKLLITKIEEEKKTEKNIF